MSQEMQEKPCVSVTPFLARLPPSKSSWLVPLVSSWEAEILAAQEPRRDRIFFLS